MKGISNVVIPRACKEAVKSEHNEEWLDGLKAELSPLGEERVWRLTKLLEDRHSTEVQPTCDRKVSSTQTIAGLKARLVDERLMKIERLEYSEIFQSVSEYSTVQITLDFIASHRKKFMSLDTKTAFLNVP